MSQAAIGNKAKAWHKGMPTRRQRIKINARGKGAGPQCKAGVRWSAPWQCQNPEFHNAFPDAILVTR